MLKYILVVCVEVLVVSLIIVLQWYLLWTFVLKHNPTVIEIFDLDLEEKKKRSEARKHKK